MRSLQKLWKDEAGVIISAELVLVLTISVLAMVVGLEEVTKSITQELNDIANAFGAVSQTYSYNGLQSGTNQTAAHAYVKGAAFTDHQDSCDCTVMQQPKPTPKQDGSSGSPE